MDEGKVPLLIYVSYAAVKIMGFLLGKTHRPEPSRSSCCCYYVPLSLASALPSAHICNIIHWSTYSVIIRISELTFVYGLSQGLIVEWLGAACVAYYGREKKEMYINFTCLGVGSVGRITISQGFTYSCCVLNPIAKEKKYLSRGKS